MSKACVDYDGYGRIWLCKSDLTPKKLKRYGINATCKQIKSKCNNAIDGFVFTGGHGHIKKTFTYNINKLKNLF